MNILLAILILILGSHFPYVQGREPFHVLASVDGVQARISASNLVDLKRDLRTQALESLIPIYTPTSAITLDYNIRGLIALTGFAENSTNLTVIMPNTGIIRSFDGGTRDQSLTLFKDFIKEGSRLARFLKAYARYSPIDPIAGNPNSLLAQMAQADYLLGKLSPLSGCECGWSAQPIVHQFQAGTYGGRAFSSGFDTTIVTLPLRYSYSPNYRTAIIIDAPFTYIRNGGASSVIFSLGCGLRMPVLSNWALTPILRMGSGGSLDLCTAGNFVSGGLVSVYDLSLPDHVLSLTNSVSYLASTNLWLTGLNYNYHLHNTVFKNGLSLTSCQGFTVCSRPIHFKVSIEDTYFAGDRLFLRHFDEVAVSLITTGVNPWLDYDCLSAGIAYQFGEKRYKGYYVNLAYQF